MARIDDSHQPFKRVRKLGPGPKRRPPVKQSKNWKCHRGAKKYEQICEWIGPGKRKPTKNKMNPKKKRKYNKLYRAWAKNKRISAKPRLPGYKCRRTRFASCK